jgi:hypothetical protein
MPQTKSFDLDRVDSKSPIVKFLSAEIMTDVDLPLVIVWCHISTVRPERQGLRLDMDKEAFLDYVEDENANRAIANVAADVAHYISEVRYSPASRSS